MVILQGSVPKELVPTATTSMTFIQNIGGVVGVAIAGSIVDTVSTTYISDHVPTSSADAATIYNAALSQGVATMFIACVPYCALATVVSIFIKNFKLSTVIGGENVTLG